MEFRGEGVVVERQGVERLFHPAEVFGGQALQSVVPQGHQQPGVEVGGSVFDRPEMGGVQVAEIGGDLPDPVGFGGGSQTRLRGLRQIAREPHVRARSSPAVRSSTSRSATKSRRVDSMV